MNQPTLPLTSIIVGDRMRKDLGDITKLAESIKQHGIIHPPVVNQANELVAGGRRIAAMKLLGWADIPVTYKETLDDVQLRELELEENVRRQDMTWQERVLCVGEIHAIRERRAFKDSVQWGQRETGELLGVNASDVNIALKLAKEIRKGTTEVLTAAHPREALVRLMRIAEDAALARLAAVESAMVNNNITTTPIVSLPELTADEDDDGQTVSAILTGESPKDTQRGSISFPISQMVFKGDCCDILDKWTSESVDHIITDPPYGIDVEMMNQQGIGMADISRISDEHDVEENVELFERMLPLFYKVCKPTSYCIMWCDYMQWDRLYKLGIKAGFKVQRWPLVWHKDRPCLNGSPAANYTKNTEIAIVMRRERATLLKPQTTSVVKVGVDPLTRIFSHPFVKPPDVWNFLFDAVAMRGQTILDPFAGVGSSTWSAIQRGLTPLAIECNELHYNQLLERVKATYLTRYANYSSINFT